MTPCWPLDCLRHGSLAWSGDVSRDSPCDVFRNLFRDLPRSWRTPWYSPTYTPRDTPRDTAWPRRLRCAALLLLVGGLALWVAGAAQAEVHAVPVTDRVWFVQGEVGQGSPANRNFISNAGFVVTDAGVVVVDALGSPALAADLLAEIRRVTDQPVKRVIVTHYHADHVYGLQTLVAAGAEVWAHAEGQTYLNTETAQLRLLASREDLAPWVNADTRLVPADHWLRAAENRFTLGGVDFVLRHVGPAHTPEDVVVLLPQLGVLFAGDLFFKGRIPYVGQADSRLWIASLEGLMRLPARYVLPGHGPLSDDPLADMTLTRDYLATLRQTMAAAAQNLLPFEDAYAQADWSRFEAIPLFHAVNRMNAYNTYLLLEHAAPD